MRALSALLVAGCAFEPSDVMRVGCGLTEPVPLERPTEGCWLVRASTYAVVSRTRDACDDGTSCLVLSAEKGGFWSHRPGAHGRVHYEVAPDCPATCE